MFSPTGRPTSCLGDQSNFKDVIARFSQLTPQERAKRKSESLESLKKTFKKLDHDFKIEDFFGSGSQTVEELTNYSRLLQTQVSEKQKRLSYWANPDKVNNMDHIRAQEESLKESLKQIQVHKENFGKHHLMSLECPRQNDMHLPLGVGDEQQPSPVRWLQNCNIRHIIVPDDPSVLHQRDIGCSSDTSLQSYASYFNSAKQAETNDRGQDSLPDFSQNACLALQLGGDYPYQLYDLDFLSQKRFQPDGEISFQEGLVDYQFNHLDTPVHGYNSSIQNWASTSGSCSAATFDEPPYPQQPNCTD